MDEEDADLLDQGAGAYGFGDTTIAALVAGRRFSGLTLGQTRRICALAAAEGARLGIPAAGVATGDLSPETGAVSDDDEETQLPLLVGIVLAEAPADAGRSAPLEVEDLRRRTQESLARLSDLWPKLDEEQGSGDEDGEGGLYLCATGPLAGAYLAFGAPASRGDTPPAEGLKVWSGQAMDQTAHEDGVMGVRVAFAEYEGDPAACIDLSPEAHAARETATAAIGDAKAYFLYARYD